MQTEVIMKRELFGCQISQKSKSEFFSATDLVKAGNRWRIINEMSPFNFSQYLNTQQAKDFISSIEGKYMINAIVKARGRGTHTWVHPLLFIDIALAINPKLKIEVYEWLFDNLIKFRNESGVSYKRMCGTLFAKTTQKTKFYEYISTVAEKIKLACNVKNDWNDATEEQLKLRDKIQDNISLLCEVLSSTDEAVRLGILKTTKLLK
jgi:hypothetical protein